MKRNMVLVRLGWRKTTDGETPRIPRPGPNGIGVPGDYIGWRKKHDEAGKFAGWELMDAPELIEDSMLVRQMIKDGHLLVEDAAHELKTLEPPRPQEAPAQKIHRVGGGSRDGGREGV